MRKILPHLRLGIQARKLKILSVPTVEERDGHGFENAMHNLARTGPSWLFPDLCKIQAAQGIPLENLLSKLLEDFVLDNWDLSSDSPRKETWDG